MVLTPSEMLGIGAPLPAFELPDTEGHLVSPAQFADAPALLIVFLCSHCEYTQLIRAGLAEYGKEYQERGVAIIGVNANDATYAADRPERMAEERRVAGYTFPYVFDEKQELAQALHAACTPDFFLFDDDRELAYRGQFDDARPGNGRAVTGADLRAATEAVLRKEPVTTPQRPSMGCNIKWRRGNEPDYFKPPLSYRLLRMFRIV